MLRNANNGQLLELASMLTRNMPKNIDEGTAQAWIGNPSALRDALHKMLLTGSMARTTGFFFKGANSYITQGCSGTLLPQNCWTFDVIIFDDGRGVRFSFVNFETRNDYWELSLKAPNSDAKIAIGKYMNATRFPSKESAQPGLCFSGCGRANNTLTGHFEVLEVEIENDQVVAFAGDFVQFDEGQARAETRGSIRYNSAIPIA